MLQEQDLFGRPYVGDFFYEQNYNEFALSQNIFKLGRRNRE